MLALGFTKCRAQGDEWTLICFCLKNFHMFLQVLDNGGMFLTPTAREAAIKHGNNFARSYHVLAKASVRSGTRLWKVRPKSGG